MEEEQLLKQFKNREEIARAWALDKLEDRYWDNPTITVLDVQEVYDLPDGKQHFYMLEIEYGLIDLGDAFVFVFNNENNPNNPKPYDYESGLEHYRCFECGRVPGGDNFQEIIKIPLNQVFSVNGRKIDSCYWSAKNHEKAEIEVVGVKKLKLD